MTYNILAIGDVVGDSGTDFLYSRLRSVKKQYDIAFTVVNGENASTRGLTPRQADDMFAAGADVITLGNHAFRKSSILNYLDSNCYILRPDNFAPQTPGRGWGDFDSPFGTVRLITLSGRLEIQLLCENPFFAADRILKKDPPSVVLVDFHAEATSEKNAMAFYLDGRATALWGTHTHVQTSDARIMPKGLGYITDVGMTGPSLSVLGIKPEQSIALFLGDPPTPHETAPGPCKMEGAVFEVDPATGKCVSVKAIRIE